MKVCLSKPYPEESFDSSWDLDEDSKPDEDYNVPSEWIYLNDNDIMIYSMIYDSLFTLISNIICFFFKRKIDSI